MALPNAKILIHQVSRGFQGQATDIEIHAKEIIDVRQRLDEILAQHTGQDLEKVARDTERDYFMTRRGGQGVPPHRPGDRASAVAALRGRNRRSHVQGARDIASSI